MTPPAPGSSVRVETQTGTGSPTVNDAAWELTEIDGEWAVLRQGAFLWKVPREQLPPDASLGDWLQPETQHPERHPVFTSCPDDGSRRQGTAAL